MRVVFLIVVSLVLMFSMNAKLALIAFIFIPIVVGYSMIFFVIVGDRFRIADEAEGKLTAMVQENLTGVRVCARSAASVLKKINSISRTTSSPTSGYASAT